jgi:hypothetical protein
VNGARREALGRRVREIWVQVARERGDAKPSHLAPWEELSQTDREADMRIGETIAREERAECQRLIYEAADRQIKAWEAAADDDRPSYLPRGWWEAAMEEAAELLEEPEAG